MLLEQILNDKNSIPKKLNVINFTFLFWKFAIINNSQRQKLQIIGTNYNSLLVTFYVPSSLHCVCFTCVIADALVSLLKLNLVFLSLTLPYPFLFTKILPLSVFAFFQPGFCRKISKIFGHIWLQFI